MLYQNNSDNGYLKTSSSARALALGISVQLLIGGRLFLRHLGQVLSCKLKRLLLRGTVDWDSVCPAIEGGEFLQRQLRAFFAGNSFSAKDTVIKKGSVQWLGLSVLY